MTNGDDVPQDRRDHPCCQNCKHVSLLPEPTCHRFPPQVTCVVFPAPDRSGVLQRFATAFPTVKPEWGCGEWAPDES